MYKSHSHLIYLGIKLVCGNEMLGYCPQEKKERKEGCG